MNDIAAWLERLGLGQYTEVFVENDIDFEVLPHLREQHLEKLGVSLGHRIKLLQAITALSGDGTADTMAPEAAQRGFDTVFPVRFSEILIRCIGLLQYKKRISYLALRQEFDLDEAALEALRVELVQVERVAVDQDGAFLLWAGTAEAVASVPGAVPPPVKTPAREAERRQITVMFCDLVGSTALSTRLDLEDLRELIQAYQKTCASVIERFEGFIARYMGDGILVYFGYPQAHEQDAERALRTALGIVEAMGELNADRVLTRGVELAVRIGVATGIVVVGDLIGEGASEERNVVGETPNLAARLQSLAQPNGIVIGSVTKDLAGDGFVYEDLGAHELKGITGKVKVWGVTGEREAEFDGERPSDQAPPALVGRQEELGLLRRAWSQSRQGAGQVVLIGGEPGIGKSRLVEAIGAEAKAEGYARVTLRCSPYHTNSALYPVIQHLQHLLGWQRGDSAEQKLAALEQALADFKQLPDNSLPLLAALLSLPLPEERYPLLTLSPQQQKQQTLDLLVAWMNEAAERHPALRVWEDLHWADPSTLELLALEIEQCPTAPILNVLTFRPDFSPPWPMHSHMTLLTLNRLERAEVEALISHHAKGKTLPVEVIEHIVTKTDGVPLYIEELTKVIVTTDFLRDAGEHYELTGPLSDIAIPATLQDSLMARLDRFPSVREVAQLGAVLGREFAYEMLQAIAALGEPSLRESLGHLVEDELLYQRGRPPRARYIFKHALIQDMAYQSLLKRTRQQYHRQVAELLESRFPELTETEPELLAYHYTRAGLTELAIKYWQRAGQRASDRSAYLEAMSHLTTGLDLLRSLPETRERDQQELPLQTALGTAAMSLKGPSAPEVEATYTRARILCQQLDDTQHLSPILFGLWRFYLNRSELPVARQLAKELLGLTERHDETPLYVLAHYALGVTSFCLGEPLPARNHLEEGMARYTPALQSSPLFQVGYDPGVGCHVWAAQAQWLLGYPDQALARVHDALALATELAHPISNAFVLDNSAILCQLRRETQAVYEHAEAAVALSSERGFVLWLASCTILRGWALTALGQREEGLAQMHQGLRAFCATGSEMPVPYYLTLLVEGYGALEEIEAGLDALNEAWEVLERTGERWWQAEVHRHKGELLLQQVTPNVAEAETCFNQALDVARQQQAKSLELRAATSLARLWQQQDKNREAHALLAPVYDWFTEGFDTADLQDAKTLLDTTWKVTGHNGFR